MHHAAVSLKIIFIVEVNIKSIFIEPDKKYHCQVNGDNEMTKKNLLYPNKNKTFVPKGKLIEIEKKKWQSIKMDKLERNFQ